MHPNSALGRANPHSYHNIGQAFDVAPIPGVAFPDYVNSLKSGGVNVVEALDEASHPKAWTTGPNWHVAFGDQSVAPRKPRTLADQPGQRLDPARDAERAPHNRENFGGKRYYSIGGEWYEETE
jgi:hypothetical protein